MTTPTLITNKSQLQNFFDKNKSLYIYHRGDLDDCEWPYVKYYASLVDHKINAVILVHEAFDTPSIVATHPDWKQLQPLLNQTINLYTQKVFFQGSKEVLKTLDPKLIQSGHQTYVRMKLTDPSILEQHDSSLAFSIQACHKQEVLDLYAKSYPANWFRPEDIGKKPCFGIRSSEKLVSVAGLHFYSPDQHVAAAGDICTHPDHLNQGHAKTVVSALYKHIKDDVIDLCGSVRKDNTVAIQAYKKLGVETLFEYETCYLERS